MLHRLFRWHEKNDPKIFLCYIFIKLFVYVRTIWEQLFKIKGIFSAEAFTLFHYFLPYSLRLLSALGELSVWPDSNFSYRMSSSLGIWDASFLCVLGLSPVTHIKVKNSFFSDLQYMIHFVNFLLARHWLFSRTFIQGPICFHGDRKVCFIHCF